MTLTAFESRPLPRPLRHRLHDLLCAAHRKEPLSTVDVRATASRVAAIVGDLGLRPTVYRGALDLRGSEVDHVWLAVVAHDAPPLVLDAAFPLFDGAFVAVLRQVVAGDLPESALDAAAAPAGVDDRVLGVFPSPMRYRGAPVWSERRRSM